MAFAASGSRAYNRYVVCGQLAGGVALAFTGALRPLEPAFLLGIKKVVRLSSSEQVVRVNAGRCVTSVANEKTFRNRSMVVFVAHTMSLGRSFTSPCRDRSIAVPIFGADIKPATGVCLFLDPSDHSVEHRHQFMASVRTQLGAELSLGALSSGCLASMQDLAAALLTPTQASPAFAILACAARRALRFFATPARSFLMWASWSPRRWNP